MNITQARWIVAAIVFASVLILILEFFPLAVV
jgi:hypothetical protein